MRAWELENRFAELLDTAAWSSKDSSLNGLQVGSRDAEIGKVAFAVDASRESIQRAVHLGAQALVVHHGLFWGKPTTLTGILYQRVSLLIQHGLCLFAYHLPLDAHPELGNNAVLARRMGLIDLKPFGDYKGHKIGVQGRFTEPLDFELWLDRFSGGDRSRLLSVLSFGPAQVTTAGVISGGGPWEIDQAIAAGLDLYVTGDAQHGIYHTAKEARIHVVCAGHYFTEIWGIHALCEWTRRELGLEAFFLDLPTGL